MMQLPQIAAKNLKIIQLPAGTTGRLQPADVYFNRPFKNFFRRICNRVRWQHNDFILAKRENILAIMDMLWFQFKAPRYESFLKYSWYRAGFVQKHPPEFHTPVQYCFHYKGYVKCEEENCIEFCFLKCSYCELHFCFNHILGHRHPTA